MRTLITTVAIGLAVFAPAAAAETRAPVTRAEASRAAHGLAQQAATKLEGQSATGIEILTGGAARVDRSRTSVGNYLRYSKFRMGVSFALFGTNTVDGVTRTLWCIAGNVTCPIS
jgi:serine protease inhibitor ecotin